MNDLLPCLARLDGRIVISGYNPPLYRNALPDWHQVFYETQDSVSQGSIALMNASGQSGGTGQRDSIPLTPAESHGYGVAS